MRGAPRQYEACDAEYGNAYHDDAWANSEDPNVANQTSSNHSARTFLWSAPPYRTPIYLCVWTLSRHWGWVRQYSMAAAVLAA